MPERKQPLDFRQAPAPDRFRLPASVHQGLEVPFQVGLAGSGLNIAEIELAC